MIKVKKKSKIMMDHMVESKKYEFHPVDKTN
jgi:hypothetical protein